MAKKNSGSKAGLGLAAIAAAGAAAAAGYYFYASKEAPKHRKIAAKWAGDLKREVVKEAKMLKNVDKASVMKIVDKAAKSYAANGPKIDKEAVAKAARELKNHWDQLRAEVQKNAPKVAKKAAPKKAAKKSAKKSK